MLNTSMYINDPQDPKHDKDHILSIWHSLNNYAHFQGSQEPFVIPINKEDVQRGRSHFIPTNQNPPHIRRKFLLKV